jgi:hypothetical protein
MKDFKNMIIGFVKQAKAQHFLDDFQKKVSSSAHSSYILTGDKANELFSPEGESGEVAGNIKRFFQKHIGGGPAELIRDLKDMHEEDRLVVVETDELSKEQVETARELALEYDLEQAKHFGDYSVEHLTHKPGHRAEMQ